MRNTVLTPGAQVIMREPRGAPLEIYPSLSTEELLRRCSVLNEVGAWEEFLRRFHRVIAMAILRTARRFGNPSPQLVDDLVQETYLKLCSDRCRVLREFDITHANSFTGFIKIIAANVTRDHFKSISSLRRGSGRVQEIPESLDPGAPPDGLGGAKAIERDVLIQQIENHLEKCLSGRDRTRNWQIFWLYYRAGLSAAAIAGIPSIGLSTKGVESLLLRITRDLRVQIATSGKSSTGKAPESLEGISPSQSL